MQIFASSADDYIRQIPDDRKEAFSKLREIIKSNLPEGFEETLHYGMLTWVVPHSIFSAGYHVDPKIPLPFISIASQKNFIAFYHMGIYADKKLSDWFIAEYPKYSRLKLDMGKSCIRFKNISDIPYSLIAELLKKISVEAWIELYTSKLRH